MSFDDFHDFAGDFRLEENYYSNDYSSYDDDDDYYPSFTRRQSQSRSKPQPKPVVTYKEYLVKEKFHGDEKAAREFWSFYEQLGDPPFDKLDEYLK